MPGRIIAFATGLLAVCSIAALTEPAPADEAKPAKDLQKETQARLISLNEKAIPLSQALKELAKQTSSELEDRREDRSDDPKLRLKFDKATYWQAVDAIAKEADLKVVLDPREGKAGLM